MKEEQIRNILQILCNAVFSRKQMKLHSSEIQIHAAEITRLRDELEIERSRRRGLEEREQRAPPPPTQLNGTYRSGFTTDQSRMGQILDRSVNSFHNHFINRTSNGHS